MLPANQERKPTRIEGTQQAKEREGKEAERQQAHKPTKGVPPPIARSSKHFPSSQIRAKESAKSRLGRFEKIFGKIFRGNVSGERKTPRVVSTGGVLQMKNCNVSNLGNASNQKRTKALLNNRWQR